MGNSRRNPRSYDINLLITYDCATKQFQYPETAGQFFAGKFDDRPLDQIMREDGLASEEAVDKLGAKLYEIATADKSQVHFSEMHLKGTDGVYKWYCVGIVSPIPGGLISITFVDIEDELAEIEMSGRDNLTGLLQHNTFCDEVEEIIREDERGILAGEYAMVCFDIIRFKAVNDIFGNEEGDRLLKHVGAVLQKTLKPEDFSCRSNADRFLFFTRTSGKELGIMVDKLMDSISDFDLPFEIMCNMGIYVTCDTVLPAGMMIDRARLAQSTIKGSYTIKVSYYQESLRAAMLTE